MPDAVTITVATKTAPLFDPKTGQPKKQGKITDTTGKNWQVWADKLAFYEEGKSYIIQQYKANEFNGMTFNLIEKVVPATPGTQPQVTKNVGTTRSIYPPTTVAPPSVEDYKLTERIKRRDIFVQVGMKNVDVATMSEADIESIVNKLTKVWHNTLGRESVTAIAAMKPSPVQRRDDMDDEIPL